MSTSKESEFEDLAQLWQEDAGPSATALKQRVRRAVLLNRLALVGEIVVAIAGGTIGIWLAVTGQWLIGVAALVFSVFGLAMSVSTRWHSSRFDTETLQAAFQSAMNQTSAQLRSLVAGIWVCAAALLFLAIIGWDATTGVSDYDLELLRPVRALSAGSLAVGIALGFVAIRLRRVHRYATTLRKRMLDVPKTIEINVI